jgi:hypothetical protein
LHFENKSKKGLPGLGVLTAILYQLQCELSQVLQLSMGWKLANVCLQFDCTSENGMLLQQLAALDNGMSLQQLAALCLLFSAYLILPV